MGSDVRPIIHSGSNFRPKFEQKKKLAHSSRFIEHIKIIRSFK